MKLARLAIKAILLLLLLVFAFGINAYASDYFASYFFPRVFPRPYTEMVSAALVGALATSATVAWPLVLIFAARAWIAALAISAPFVALRFGDFLHYVGSSESRIVVMSLVEAFVYPAAILAGVWLASRYSRNKGAGLT